MRKNSSSFFVSLIVILQCLTAIVFADDYSLYTDNGFQYYVEENTITIVKYYGNDTVVTIPRFINKLEVKTINSGAFTDSNYQKIKVPDSITYIENDAINNTTLIEWYGIDGSVISEETESIKQETYDKAEEKDEESVKPIEKETELDAKEVQEEKKSDTDTKNTEKIIKPSDIPMPYVPYTPSKSNTDTNKKPSESLDKNTQKSDTIIINDSSSLSEYQEAEINLEEDIIEEAKKPSNIVNRVFGSTNNNDDVSQIDKIIESNFSDQQSRTFSPNFVRNNKTSNIVIGVISMSIFVALLIYIYVKFVRE